MKQKLIVIDKITSIEIHDMKVNRYYEYLPYQKKTFWKSEREEGFYGAFMPYMTIEDMKKECIVIDNVAYFKPYIKINMGSDHVYKSFGNMNQLEYYIEQNFSKLNIIKYNL